MSQEATEKGVPFDCADFIAWSDGSVVSRTLVDRKTGTLTLFSFDKGQGLSEHTAPFDAVVYILDGSAEITIGGKKNVVSKGQMIIMPAGMPHALHAPERFKMLLILIRSAE